MLMWYFSFFIENGSTRSSLFLMIIKLDQCLNVQYVFAFIGFKPKTKYVYFVVTI